jgi:hypothetical protein
MSSPPQAQIDELILSFARTDWRKVAMIIGRVLFHCRDTGLSIDHDDFDLRVAERIVALVEAGKLQAQGNLSRWRHSEVRLPQ